MKKIALVLLLAAALTLSACSQGGEAPGGNAEPVEENTPAASSDEENSPEVNADAFAQTNEFGANNNMQGGQVESDVFGTTNEFGSGEASETYEFGSGEASETYEPGSANETNSSVSAQPLPASYESTAHFPATTVEKQYIIDTYLDPYGYSGIYRTNFSPRDMSQLSGYNLMLMFDALCREFGGYPSAEEIEALQGRVSGDVFEGKLLNHMHLTPQMIRETCATVYNPDDGTYELPDGLGGGPILFAVADYQQTDSTLTISYGQYGMADYVGDDGYTHDYIKLYYTGTAVIELYGDSYVIASNQCQEW